jgi:hypothetical protein
MENIMSIASVQEGHEWIARLREELDSLTLDLLQHKSVLNEYTIMNIEYAIDRIANIIAEIHIEVGLMGDEVELGNEG